MLDVVGAFTLGVICTADVAVLIGLAKARFRARFALFVLAGMWTVVVLATAARGGFAPGTNRVIPAPLIAFLGLLLLGLTAWSASRAFRAALRSVPLAGLIGIHAFRIVGIFFLILHDRGRLAAPFATNAGWGDILTGVVAIPLAVAAYGGAFPRTLLRLWNIFGALDLIDAIILAAVSALGTPFQLFSQPPGSAVMSTLPWVGIPTLLVPLYLLTHLEIAARIRSAARPTSKKLPQIDTKAA